MDIEEARLLWISLAIPFIIYGMLWGMYKLGSVFYEYSELESSLFCIVSFVTLIGMIYINFKCMEE